jgi:DNA-binding MarR family transcriptional regulator
VVQPDREAVAALAVTMVTASDWLRRASAMAQDPIDTGVLRLAVERGQVRPSELAEHLDVNPATITRHVRALVESGEVSLSSDAADGRASLVQVTDRGRTRLRGIYDRGVDSFAALVTDWSNEDVLALTSLLGRLMAAGEAAQSAVRASDRAAVRDA